MKKLVFSGLLAAMAFGFIAFNSETAEAQRGLGAIGEVYVSSQGLYYDTFVTATRLPPVGPFQLLVNGVTEFGPGDPGYVGGRWMVPNDQGGYDYFLCPLLGPGREEPREQ